MIKILVVDDKPITRNPFSSILEENGTNAATPKNGQK